MPQFREVGDALLKKYEKAKMVVAQKTDTGINLVIKRWYSQSNTDWNWFYNIWHFRRGRGVEKEPLKPKNLDLVYLQQSPNYCEKNIILGSSGEFFHNSTKTINYFIIYFTGTQGRKCSRASTGVDSCKLLCCGRGYATKLFHNTWQCNCKFEWALMNVKCEICSERTEEYFCK